MNVHEPTAHSLSRSLLSSVPYFFTWSPTSGVNKEVIPKNGGTRPPAHWDRDLTSRLGEIADSALERAQANLLKHSKPDQLSEKMKSLGAACIKNTNCESKVRDFYKESIAPLCLAMAGALSFGTVEDFLEWQSERYRQTQAKADGFLVIAGHGPDFLVQFENGVQV